MTCVASASASPSTSVDVVPSAITPSTGVLFHGDLIEFRDQQRCEACIARDRKCIIAQGEECCMLCYDAGRLCVFERSIRLRASAGQLGWDALSAIGSLFNTDTLRKSLSCDPESRSLSWDSPKNTSTNSAQRTRGSCYPAESSRLDSLIAPPAIPALQGIYRRAFQKNRALRHWMKALLICSVLLAFHKAEQLAHGKTLESSKKGRKRALTDTARMHARQVRKSGACCTCRKRRVMCSHTRLPTSRSVSPARDVDCTSSPLDAPVANEVFRDSAGTPLPSVCHWDDVMAAEVRSRARSAESMQADETQRPESVKIKCPTPGCTILFQGQRELRRHLEHFHNPARVVWVCNDISEDKLSLKGCKACESGKMYNAVYNAAEHLRRRHFGQKSKGPHQLQSARDVQVPPMTELRKWLREVVVFELS